MLALFLSYLDDDKDKRIFEEIYHTYRKQMFLLALSINKNEIDAEDIVSKVFLKIAQKYWKTVKLISNNTDLRNYLLKATKNTALNEIKFKKSEFDKFNIFIERRSNDIQNISDKDFLDYICKRYDYSNTVDAINKLDEKYRNVLYYHYVLEISIKDTAKSLGQSIDTTKKQITRGKKMLIELLKGVNEYADV